MADLGAITALIGLVKPAALLILGAAMGVAIVLGVDRHRKMMKDETRLQAASRYLEKHLQALALLDADDAPAEFLDLAIRFSELIQDPRTRSTIAFILSRNPKTFERRPDGWPENDVAATWEKVVSANRPELWRALVLANITGMQAFVLRWPECSPAFDDILVNLAAWPVREAEIVIRETKLAMSYQQRSKVALEAA